MIQILISYDAIYKLDHFLTALAKPSWVQLSTVIFIQRVMLAADDWLRATSTILSHVH